MNLAQIRLDSCEHDPVQFPSKFGARATMDYRLYFLDAAGHIARRVDFEAPNDAMALAHVKQFVNGRALELWSGTRTVAKIGPNKP